MKDWQDGDLRFFAESAPYLEKEQNGKEEAIKYLKDWKKFLLIKLRDELHDYEPYDGQVVDGDKIKNDPNGWYEHWIERSAFYGGVYTQNAVVSLKFCMKKKLPYQIN